MAPDFGPGSFLLLFQVLEQDVQGLDGDADFHEREGERDDQEEQAESEQDLADKGEFLEHGDHGEDAGEHGQDPEALHGTDHVDPLAQVLDLRPDRGVHGLPCAGRAGCGCERPGTGTGW